MKTLIATFLGLSLFIGSSLLADDKFAGFYPVEDIDTPDYILAQEQTMSGSDFMLSLDSADSKAHKHLSDFVAFYPVEDDDTPSYLADDRTSGSDFMLSLDTRDIKAKGGHGAFSSFYPIEDDDSVRY